MSRIAETFASLEKKGEKALVLFVTAGDPSLEDLPAILDALAGGGADLIEVGEDLVERLRLNGWCGRQLRPYLPRLDL